MFSGSNRIIYLLFFFSGVAGLIYEIIWSRLLVLIFGSTTNSIVAVISAFLGGLAIGSLIAGKYSDKLSQKKLIRTYALLELGVGLTSASTLLVLPAIKTLYGNFSDGASVTLDLLFVKFALTIIVLLIPTILMGATLPVLMKFAEISNKSIGKSVSLLYATNTLGGVVGVILAAFVLIEATGLTTTLLIAVAINMAISLTALLIRAKEVKQAKRNQEETSFYKILTKDTSLIIFAFAVSGMVAIAYEVLWSRVLTPTIGTFIYAFATVLAIYILGIGIGSFVYERFSRLITSKYLAFGLCQMGIGFFALLSVLITHKFQIKSPFEIALMILPATILMGLTFPLVVSQIANEKSLGRTIGLSYFANTIGAILGGFIASFILIPIFGSSQAIAVLSLVNFTLALTFIYSQRKGSQLLKLASLTLAAILICVNFYLITFKSHRLYQVTNDLHILESKIDGSTYNFKEDEVASVFGFSNKKKDDLGLFIDGVATTSRVAETRLMSHIPVTLHKDPRKMLVICFGMGTTFRSSLKHNLEVDAVELVPSVPTFMHYYHQNAQEVLNNPKGRVIINDGRNYAFLTNKKYDIATIDPPPPFNAAGTSVLHSKEFYRDLSSHLQKDGIVSQWIYYNKSRKDEISMAIKSFIDVFPYVLAIQKTGSVGGFFLEGSYSPIQKERLDNLYKNPVVIDDLNEIFSPKLKTEEFSQTIGLEIVGNRKSLEELVNAYPPITDDRPRNEYFIIRQKFTKSPILEGKNAIDFSEELKSTYSKNQN